MLKSSSTCPLQQQRVLIKLISTDLLPVRDTLSLFVLLCKTSDLSFVCEESGTWLIRRKLKWGESLVLQLEIVPRLNPAMLPETLYLRIDCSYVLIEISGHYIGNCGINGDRYMQNFTAGVINLNKAAVAKTIWLFLPSISGKNGVHIL